MEFRVLGPIELWSAGERCDLGPARVRSILAILLLTPRTLVPAELLIDRIWATRPPPKARENLTVYITRLRGSLRSAVADGARLTGRAGGYELDVDPEAVDLHEFRRLRQQADARAARGEGAPAARLLREADRLWRGPALAGVGGDWMARMRDSLAEERRAAIARRVECELELGRHAELLSELRHLLAQYPFDEALIAHQMTALYRSGRPGDALSLYRDTRRRLIEEHGTEPGPLLAGLHQRILSHDPGLAPGARPGDRPPGPPPQPETLPPETPPPETLPPETPPPETGEFVGRQAELELLTRRRAILILDDAPGPDPIGPLLPAAGRSLIITTRRLPPSLAGARTLTLDMLPSDDADLVEGLPRAPARLAGGGAASPGLTSAFDLPYRSLATGHQRFFRRLGVNPCPDVSLRAAAALAGVTLAEAEQACAALLEHRLLAPGPAGQFRFHDLIREYARARVAREESSAERRQAVGRLLDYYLHTADRADRSLFPFRHRMRVPVTGPPAATPALRRQEDAAGWLDLEWRNILQTAQYAGRHEWKQKCADLIHVLGGFLETRACWDEAAAAHALALQASRDLGDPARIAQAALELSEVNQQTGRHEAALPLAEEAAGIYRSLGEPRGVAEALDNMARAHQRAGRYREALAYSHEARLLYADAEDMRGVANTLSHSGIACWQLGRYPDAMRRLRDALRLHRSVGDRRGEAKTLNNLGRMELYLGRHRDAIEAYETALRIFREVGGPQNEAIVHHNIGAVYYYKGSHDQGIAAYQRALAIYRGIGDRPHEADVLNDIGVLYQDAECYDEALICHEQARGIAEDIGNLAQQVTARRGIAGVRRGAGQPREALDHYQAALQLAREIGDPYEEAKILEGIAETTLSTGRPDAARIVMRQALDIFDRLGVPEAEAARIRIEAMSPGFGRRAVAPAALR